MTTETNANDAREKIMKMVSELKELGLDDAPEMIRDFMDTVDSKDLEIMGLADPMYRVAIDDILREKAMTTKPGQKPL